MISITRFSLPIVALLIPVWTKGVPPFLQDGAVEECVKYITSELSGGVEYCQDRCRWATESSQLDSRCESAGKVNLLDCVAYLEISCDQSQPGQVGVSSGGESGSSGGESGSSDNALMTCKNELGRVGDASSLPATYCADRCDFFYKNDDFQKGCDKYGYETLVDCVDYVEPFCEKNGNGTGNQPTGTPTFTTAGSGSSGLQDVDGCKATLQSADGSDTMNAWCIGRCDFFVSMPGFLDGCRYYGKTTLAECVDWVEDLCVSGGGGSSRSFVPQSPFPSSNRFVNHIVSNMTASNGLVPAAGNSLSGRSVTPVDAQSASLSACQSSIRGESAEDDTYCQGACSSHATNLGPLCLTSFRGDLSLCVDFHEPRCIRKEVYAQREECNVQITSADGMADRTAFCKERCSLYARYPNYKPACAAQGITNLLDCLVATEPICTRISS